MTVKVVCKSDIMQKQIEQITGRPGELKISPEDGCYYYVFHDVTDEEKLKWFVDFDQNEFYYKATFE